MIETITPAQYKNRASDMQISYAFCPCPFADCLLAVTRKKICFLGFAEHNDHAKALDELYKTWPGANYTEALKPIATITKQIFAGHQSFDLLVKGTEFQQRVWNALLQIPQGRLVCYQDVASAIGNPNATRAVANAIAANPIAFLIPCHRVISKTGNIHKYRWGAATKKAIIDREATKSST